MAVGLSQYIAETDFVKHQKRFWPAKIPISHWQLRHFISHSEPDNLYYASRAEVYCLNTITRKRKLIAILPFDARCTASAYGYVCVGGEDSGHFAAIKIDGSGDVDTAVQIDALSSTRRPPSVKVESIGEEIVNSISIHRIQDEEAHLDDIVAVVTNNDKTVRIYSLPSGVETTVLRLPHPMNHATISPCGTMMIAVGDHNQAFFYQRELKDDPPLIPKPHNRLTSANLSWTLLEVCELYIHDPEDETTPRGYFTTAWSPDGQYVAVGSEGGYITLFDVETLASADSWSDPVVKVIPSSRADCPVRYVGSIRTMMFSPAPLDLLIWSEDQGRVCVGDLRGGLQRMQILNLDPGEEDLEKLSVSDVVIEGAAYDEMERFLQGPQRALDEDESAWRRAHIGNGPSYAAEYLEARTRQQRQRMQNTAMRAQAQLFNVGQGLDADEQQVLETLRTSRETREALNGGRAPDVNYTTQEAIASARSSASSTPAVAEAPPAPIPDTLASVQESLPELVRTIAHYYPSTASPSPHDNDNLPAVTGDSRSWYSRFSSHANGLDDAGIDLQPPRRRSSVLLTLSNSQAAPEARAEPGEDRDAWQTIQDSLDHSRPTDADVQARLLEQRRVARREELAAATTDTELAEIQSLTRRRARLRNARTLLSNARTGAVGNTERSQTMQDGYEAFRRRLTVHSRDMGVRTAGLAMSSDGSTLWAACEEGIFEFQMNVKGRFFWPAMEPR